MKTRLTSRFPACLLGVSSENQDINCETEHLAFHTLREMVEELADKTTMILTSHGSIQ